jgi:hypothetical protein
MSDLPIVSDNAGAPILINDPVTPANIAHVTAASEVLVTGTKTNNNAAPTATLLSSVNYLANAAAPSWTEGNLVLGSVDLSGNTRVIGTKTNNNAAPGTQVGVLPALANAAAPTWVEGNQVLESVDLFGNQRVLFGTKQTYSFGSVASALATAATDVFTLSGSATKIVKVLRIEIAGTKTTAGQELVALVKRSSANTGGTSTTIVPAGHDSPNAASTAVARFYTVNPTVLGTAVGFYRCSRPFWPALLTATQPTILVWEFTQPSEQPLVLRGVNEFLAVNMQSGTVVGDTLFVSMTYTEE